jgi:hypothetical protein
MSPLRRLECSSLLQSGLLLEENDQYHLTVLDL